MTRKLSQFSGTAQAALRNYMARIQRLHEEREALSDDIAQVYREARAHGLNPKTMKKAHRELQLAPAEREAANEELDLYMAVLLGQQAIGTETVDAPADQAVQASPSASEVRRHDGALMGEVTVQRSGVGQVVAFRGEPPGAIRSNTPPATAKQPDEVSFLS